MRLRVEYVALLPLILGSNGALHAQSAADTPRTLGTLVADDAPLETVLIVAQRDARNSKGATGLDLSLADTPQSVTVLDRDTLDTFGFDEINDVLRFTTGVNVEAVETDRTYYNARGFDILSMQVDGTGMQINDLVIGALDTALYEKIEVVRGANGLLTGTGNPSGTINYVRKRPTNDVMAAGELTLGSWNRKRLEVDVSMPLVDSGKWAARAVAVLESKDSWLNLYSNERKLFYGIVDGQLGERTTVAVGYAHQDNESDGVMWGALPLLYTDGTQAEFDVSATITQSWTWWDIHTDSVFTELEIQLTQDWDLKTVLTYNTVNEPSELFWTYPSAIDRDTGLGIYGWPGSFEQDSHALLSDTSVSGRFDLWGQAHEATLGLSLSRSKGRYYEFSAPSDSAAFDAMPAFPGWTGNEVPRPEFGAGTLEAEWDTRMNRLYGATRLSASDSIKLIAGFNAVDAKSEGFSWDTPADESEHALSPYVGATWRVLPSLNAYVSYSDIYQPQSVINADLQPLGSAKGSSYEAGIKGEWLNKQLLTSFAVFKAEQDNLQQFAGYAGDDFSIAYYQGIAVRSKGYEFEVAGRPLNALKLQAGYTHLSLKDPHGVEARTFIPRDTFKLLATLQILGVPGLELGASARWQGDIYLDTDAGVIRQSAYYILGLQASYVIDKNFELSANLDNVTDKKHLTSLYWDQAFYGAPRHVNVSLSWKY